MMHHQGQSHFALRAPPVQDENAVVGKALQNTADPPAKRGLVPRSNRDSGLEKPSKIAPTPKRNALSNITNRGTVGGFGDLGAKSTQKARPSVKKGLGLRDRIKTPAPQQQKQAPSTQKGRLGLSTLTAATPSRGSSATLSIEPERFHKGLQNLPPIRDTFDLGILSAIPVQPKEKHSPIAFETFGLDDDLEQDVTGNDSLPTATSVAHGDDLDDPFGVIELGDFTDDDEA